MIFFRKNNQKLMLSCPNYDNGVADKKGLTKKRGVYMVDLYLDLDLNLRACIPKPEKGHGFKK